MMNDYVFLFEETRKIAQECNSKYKGLRVNKDDLYEFMDYNNWFGMERKGAGDDIEVVMNIKTRTALELWLRGYKQPPKVKTELLLENFEKKYPRTTDVVRRFIESEDAWDKAYTWQMLDFMFFNIKTDDDIGDDAKLLELLRKGLDELSVVAGEFLIRFISFEDEQSSRWEYRPDRRKITETRGAYDFAAFAVMAYVVFNTESWKEHDLIQKAVKEPRYASLWLWIALHFISALRSSDMKRLPVPMVTEGKEIIISRLLSDEYDDLALSAAMYWRMQLQMEELTPSKTSRHKNVPNIKVFIPTSLMIPIGVMLLAVFIHHEDDEPLITVNNDYYLIKGFFGERFVDA